MNEITVEREKVSGYYKYRRKIQELYQHDTNYGDLVGDVLKYRDSNKFITSIVVDMSSPQFVIEFDPESNKEVDIMTDIGETIINFLKEASDKLGMTPEEEKEYLNIVQTTQQFDVYRIGNQIVFNL